MAYSSVHTHTCTHHRKVDSSAGVIHPSVQSFLDCNKAQGGWGSYLPFSLLSFPSYLFLFCAILRVHLGAHHPRVLLWTCRLNLEGPLTSTGGLTFLGALFWPHTLLKYQGSGHLEPLSSPSAGPLAFPTTLTDAGGKQDNSNVAFTGKQSRQQQLPQDASVI